jgi:hypothetical protein
VTWAEDEYAPDANDDRAGGFGVVPRFLRGRLTAYEIAVYVALSWRIADQTGECFVKQKRLAEEAGCSVAQVQRVLISLRQKRLVSWRPKINPETGNTECNYYRIRTFGEGPLDLVEMDPQPPADVHPTSDGGDPHLSQTDRTRTPEREPLNKSRSLRSLDGPAPEPSDDGALFAAPEEHRQQFALDVSSSFKRWWAAYPRRVGKQAAQKAFEKAVREHGLDPVMAGLIAQRGFLESEHRRGFCPHPTTWLNQGRFMDEVHEVRPERGGNPFTTMLRERAARGELQMPGYDGFGHPVGEVG